MDIFSAVELALQAASILSDCGKNQREVNQNRSVAFVKALASQLNDIYRNDPTVSVLHRHDGENRERFGLSELLFDILVCQTVKTKSAARRKELTFVKRGLWAVESELAKNSREAIFDFNKLILSSCESKLFVGPITSNVAAFLKPLETAAEHCKGSTYIALVTHPADWGKKPLRVERHKMH